MVCRAVLRQDDYEYINMLVVYFQMVSDEPGSAMRMMKALGCCTLADFFVGQ